MINRLMAHDPPAPVGQLGSSSAASIPFVHPGDLELASPVEVLESRAGSCSLRLQK